MAGRADCARQPRGDASTPPIARYRQTCPVLLVRTARSIMRTVRICPSVKTHSDIVVDVARKTRAGFSTVASAIPAATEDEVSRTRVK